MSLDPKALASTNNFELQMLTSMALKAYLYRVKALVEDVVDSLQQQA